MKSRLFHESDGDENDHCSTVLNGIDGQFYATWHVTTDSNVQPVIPKTQINIYLERANLSLQTPKTS